MTKTNEIADMFKLGLGLERFAVKLERILCSNLLRLSTAKIDQIAPSLSKFAKPIPDHVDLPCSLRSGFGHEFDHDEQIL